TIEWLALYTIIEPGFAIICSCLVTYLPLLRSFAKLIKSICTSRATTSRNDHSNHHRLTNGDIHTAVTVTVMSRPRNASDQAWINTGESHLTSFNASYEMDVLGGHSRFLENHQLQTRADSSKSQQSLEDKTETVIVAQARASCDDTDDSEELTTPNTRRERGVHFV
ncbi:hypothetical protein MMC14_004951, partial [Varicellaria rhodocarpa]|nr:hypothetical protein [Varicellaria rhodocarpa]